MEGNGYEEGREQGNGIGSGMDMRRVMRRGMCMIRGRFLSTRGMSRGLA